jgi:hypothetical protein
MTENRSGRGGIRRTFVAAGVVVMFTSAGIAAACVSQRDDASALHTVVADVITDVDWQHASITLPANIQDCPEGTVTLKPVPSGDYRLAKQGWAPGTEGKPNLVVRADKAVYGDLTGDGQPEAVLNVRCDSIKPDPGFDEHLNIGGRLLAVAMRSDHTLAALDYVGPVGASFPTVAVQDLQIKVQVHGGATDNGHASYSINTMTHARTYRWNGSRFDQTAGRTSALPLDDEKDKTGSPVHLAAIGRDGTTVCPAEVVRFHESQAAGAAVTYHLQAKVQEVDVDDDGNEEMVAQVDCVLPGGGSSARSTSSVRAKTR